MAGNPSTPLDVLGSLGRIFPDVVAHNPVLDWLLLENANWPAEFDPVTRHRIVAEPSTAPGLMWWAARFGSAHDRLGVAQNAAAPAEIVAYLEADADVSVVQAARAHVGHARPVRLEEELASLGGSGPAGELVGLMMLDLVPAWLFDAVDRPTWRSDGPWRPLPGPPPGLSADWPWTTTTR